ncbi:MAG: hypothetical protein A3B37_00210 [Candidatus Sungbacteria bacterium RIFCSPLOWO2_01_FULL_59_16]|uniref:Uncharacterized protein n=1 Tax=Candidatus Sungbacteria bacterium RIFCSPLOWO2_01_FULL_59_16 TaxID=1802280 RepID=A0A1G2LAB1_9BACT|nr:MAG: hypothetical protein A3B37_00210 [Candidatus Sungbacteria bacterium RIFCSPLOWO2_01_FULL_59_16]
MPDMPELGFGLLCDDTPHQFCKMLVGEALRRRELPLRGKLSRLDPSRDALFGDGSSRGAGSSRVWSHALRAMLLSPVPCRSLSVGGGKIGTGLLFVSPRSARRQTAKNPGASSGRVRTETRVRIFGKMKTSLEERWRSFVLGNGWLERESDSSIASCLGSPAKRMLLD